MCALRLELIECVMYVITFTVHQRTVLKVDCSKGAILLAARALLAPGSEPRGLAVCPLCAPLGPGGGIRGARGL